MNLRVHLLGLGLGLGLRLGLRLVPGILLCLGLALMPSVARARVTVSVNLDYTSAGAVAVWVARVTGVKPAGKDRHQGTPVELLDVHVRIEEAFKGPRAPRAVVRHLRVAPGAPSLPNGFSFLELKVGETYLLFLSRDRAGRLVLYANEDHNLLTLSQPDLATFRLLPKTAPLATRLVDLASVRLAQCTRGCMAAIWLLSSSQTHRERIKAARARQIFIAQLVRISRDAIEENDLNAAYTVLGQLDHRAILPELERRICAPQGTKGAYLQVNAVGWLQGFPSAVQLASLRRVERQAGDPMARAAATRRIQYLTRSRQP